MSTILAILMMTLGQADAGCPAGQVSNADTDGHCCWPDQAWSRSRQRCIGHPACPEALRADPASETCVCPTGRVVSEDTAGNCCWPGQGWSRSRGACVGTPSCSPPLVVFGEQCVAADPVPALASPAEAPKQTLDVIQPRGAVDATATREQIDRGPSDEGNELALSSHPASRAGLAPSVQFAVQVFPYRWGTMVFPGGRLGLDLSRFFGVHAQWGLLPSSPSGVFRASLGLEVGTPNFELPAALRRLALGFRVSVDGLFLVSPTESLSGVMASPAALISIAVTHDLSIDLRGELNVFALGIASSSPVTFLAGGTFGLGLRWGATASPQSYVKGEPAELREDSSIALEAGGLPRKSPDDRIEEFDRDYRDIAFNGYAGGGGYVKLKYPLTKQLSATWTYVSLARDFEERQDFEGASRAYWSALRASRKSIGSHVDVARLRVAAFSGLAGISERRKQPRLAALLRLCAGLNRAYLGAPSAGEHHHRFHEQYTTAIAEIERQDALRSKAETARGLAIALAVVSVAGAVTGAATGDSALQAESRAQAQVAHTTVSAESVVLAALVRENAELDEEARRLLGMQEDSSTPIEESQTFAAIEVVEIVRQTAASTEAKAALTKWASGEGERTVAALNAYLQSPNLLADGSLKQLAGLIASAQKSIERCERQRRSCP